MCALLLTIIPLLLGVSRRSICLLSATIVAGFFVFMYIWARSRGGLYIAHMSIRWYMVALFYSAVYIVVAGPIVLSWPRRKTQPKEKSSDGD